MDRNELEKYNVGENLDALMTLDPRGYGVCRILYAGSRARTGAPLTVTAPVPKPFLRLFPNAEKGI